MGVSINKATNANIYVDGSSAFGKADEVDLPDAKSKDVDHSPLGFIGSMDYSAGLDKMEARIKWNSYYPDIIRKFSNVLKGIKIQVRWSLEKWENNGRVSQVPAVAYLTVRPKNVPGGKFKAKDNVELESQLSVSYYKLEIDGVEQLEIDYEAQIYSVNGEDQMATYRAHLGI